MSEETQVLAADAVAQEPAVLETEQNQSTEAAAEEPTQQEAEAKQAEEEEHKRKGGWQRKIEKQNRRLEEQSQQIAFLRGKLGLDLEQPGPEEAQKSPERPAREKFENDDDYHIALGRWGAQEELRTQESKRHQEESGKPLIEAINKAAQEIEDFHDVVGPFIKSQQRSHLVDSYLADPTVGPYLAYHLATNDGELARLNGLTPSSLAKAIVELEPRFLKSAPSAKTATVSKAPPPPTPVGRSASGQDEDIRNTTDMEKYKAWLRKTNPDWDRA